MSHGAKNVVKDYVKPSASAPTAPEMPRKLKPEEFDAKHGIDPNAVLDDDFPF